MHVTRGTPLLCESLPHPKPCTIVNLEGHALSTPGFTGINGMKIRWGSFDPPSLTSKTLNDAPQHEMRLLLPMAVSMLCSASLASLVTIVLMMLRVAHVSLRMQALVLGMVQLKSH